jgi:hypothetical protein
MLQTPVALFIFNRPEQTQRVFAEIARAQPRRLLIIADGPRTAAEAELCQATRQIVQQVDWECEMLTALAEQNLGCKRRMLTGLNWVFDQCEEAIVLEDDCLPHPSFFTFCEELLAKYRDEPRVLAISGNNFLAPKMQQRMRESYYFSYSPLTWGWAAWRRTWKLFDFAITAWPALRETDWLARRLANPQFKPYWEKIFDATYRGETNAWDYQLTFAGWLHESLSIVPRVNLVSNIGFGAAATHTLDPQSHLANLPTHALPGPLLHPRRIVRHQQADELTFRRNYLGQIHEPPPLWRRALGKAARVTRRLIAPKIS